MLFSFDCLQPVVRAAALEPVVVAYLTFECLGGLKYLFSFSSFISLYSYNTVLVISECTHNVQVGIPLSWHVNIRTPSSFKVLFFSLWTISQLPLDMTESWALPGDRVV